MFVRNLRSKRDSAVDAQMKRISSTIIIGCAAQNCICQTITSRSSLFAKFVQCMKPECTHIVRKFRVVPVKAAPTNHTAGMSMTTFREMCQSVHMAKWEPHRSAGLRARDTVLVSYE